MQYRPPAPITPTPMQQSKKKSSLSAQLFCRPDIPIGCLDGLEQYSHVWVLYIFHCNTDLQRLWSPDHAASGVKAKVQVPRLNGQRVGVLATRSPHRPSPIGRSCADLQDHLCSACKEVSRLLLPDCVGNPPLLTWSPDRMPHWGFHWVASACHRALKSDSQRDQSLCRSECGTAAGSGGAEHRPGGR